MGEFFESWRPTASAVQEQRGFPLEQLYSLQSPPLALPSQNSGQHSILPLFQAASCSAAATPGSQDGMTNEDAQDAVLHVGGPVWAMAWCPSEVSLPAAGPSNGAQHLTAKYLAVGCHQLHSQHNLLGKPLHGPALIQLWEVTSTSQPAQQQHGQHGQQGQQASAGPAPRLPRLALGIVHDGGMTWNCQWCPAAELADEPAAGTAAAAQGGQLPRLGLLAAALGDGTVRVWAVPQPAAIQQQLGSGGSSRGSSSAGQAPFVSLEPVAVLSSQQLGGSMPACIDWLPSKPHDLLLVGCWDGHVAIIKLNPHDRPPPSQQQQQQQPGAAAAGSGSPAAADGAAGAAAAAAAAPYGWELLSYSPGDVLPLRSVRWLPPAVCRGAVDLAQRHIFGTAGHDGAFKIWDSRDLAQPLYSQVLSTTTLLGCIWTSSPLGAIVSVEDGSLRCIPMDAATLHRNFQTDRAVSCITLRGHSMGALWSLDVHQPTQLVAYGGEDGEVGVFLAEFEGDARRRSPHTPASGFFKEADVLAVRSAAQLLGKHGLFSGRVVERTQIQYSRFPHEDEAIHRVAWFPGGSAWQPVPLASGGAAGLVRVQLVRAAGQ